MSIGTVIKDRRLELNIKQDSLADSLKVTVQTISKWENDKTEPKATQVCELAKILKLTEKEICKGEILERLDSPVEFMTALSGLKVFVSDIDMMLTIYENVDDEIRFLKELNNHAKKSPFLTEEE